MRRGLDPPADAGLQQERTALAWDRTGLSLSAAALGVGRHAFGELGGIVVVACGTVALCVLWLWLERQRRARWARQHGIEPAFRVLADGRLVAVVAVVLVVLCLTEAAASLAGHLGPG